MAQRWSYFFHRVLQTKVKITRREHEADTQQKTHRWALLFFTGFTPCTYLTYLYVQLCFAFFSTIL